MSIEADFYNTYAKYKSLDIEKSADYLRNRFYKIIWQTAMSYGSMLKFETAKTLLETNLTVERARLWDYEIVSDFYNAYTFAKKIAISNKVLTYNDVDSMFHIAMFRSCGQAKCLRPDKLSDFCEQMNVKSQNADSMQLIDKYLLSFEAFFMTKKLSLWNFANTEMSYLMTHFFQFRFGLTPTLFLRVPQDKDDILSLHIEGLNAEISAFLSSQNL